MQLKNLLQEDIEKLCGVSSSWISCWETNSLFLINRYLTQLVEILGINVSNFYASTNFTV